MIRATSQCEVLPAGHVMHALPASSNQHNSNSPHYALLGCAEHQQLHSPCKPTTLGLACKNSIDGAKNHFEAGSHTTLSNTCLTQQVCVRGSRRGWTIASTTAGVLACHNTDVFDYAVSNAAKKGQCQHAQWRSATEGARTRSHQRTTPQALQHPWEDSTDSTHRGRCRCFAAAHCSCKGYPGRPPPFLCKHRSSCQVTAGLVKQLTCSVLILAATRRPLAARACCSHINTCGQRIRLPQHCCQMAMGAGQRQSTCPCQQEG